MKRIQALNRYQKIILTLSLVLLIGFTIVYVVTSIRMGYAYKGSLLMPHSENGNTIYTGRVDRKDTTITVTPDRTVTICYDDEIYGPYIVKEDPTAIPDSFADTSAMFGIEITEGNSIFFRGGVFGTVGSDSDVVFFNEKGGIANISVTYTTNNDTQYDLDGNPIDPLTPSVSAVWELMHGPKLTSRGDWRFWLIASAACILTIIHIFSADKLFRRNLSYMIRDPESAEPSEWEIAKRYIAWTFLPILALVSYIIGLGV